MRTTKIMTRMPRFLILVVLRLPTFRYFATLVGVRVSVGGFTPCRQLGSYSRRKQVWTYSVLVENKFGLFQVLGDRIYEMRCPFVAVGPNARFIVLPHWDNMS